MFEAAPQLEEPSRGALIARKRWQLGLRLDRRHAFDGLDAVTVVVDHDPIQMFDGRPATVTKRCQMRAIVELRRQDDHPVEIAGLHDFVQHQLILHTPKPCLPPVNHRFADVTARRDVPECHPRIQIATDVLLPRQILASLVFHTSRKRSPPQQHRKLGQNLQTENVTVVHDQRIVGLQLINKQPAAIIQIPHRMRERRVWRTQMVADPRLLALRQAVTDDESMQFQKRVPGKAREREIELLRV